ncbi:helix-turn-helix transcriptional regulator [Labrys monachus]|uniref:DNA-binding transcriptional regulator YafY n=1 Tax=Labrys monachus TaxID=217067 RepID=A0ABU0FBN8_9HYPH|nr:YafY family protein [Labrys monachus]MDQ0391742.1 putative DNA-binding transcriptional regulator YafY [Labrys monachus]
MRRTTRLFEIIQLLRVARRPLTAETIATQLEVTKRTVYRDIASLQALSVPIHGEAGIGYVMRAGYDLPPLMLSIDEVEALVVALGLVERTGDRGLKAAAASIRAKVTTVLPVAARQPIQGRSLYVSNWGSSEPTAVDLAEVRRAIREERKLALFYGDAQGQETNRIIRPIAVVYYVEVVSIVGWCELRGDFRSFRADRIRACKPTEERFAGEGARLRDLWQARQE